MLTRRQFTFIEVLVAVFLLSVAAAALVSMIVFHLRFSDLLDNRRLVSQLATSRVEQLTQIDFAEILLAEEKNVRVDEDGIPSLNGAFLRTTSLTSDADGAVTMTVVVRFPGNGVREATEFQLTSLRAD